MSRPGKGVKGGVGKVGGGLKKAGNAAKSGAGKVRFKINISYRFILSKLYNQSTNFIKIHYKGL